MSTRIEGQIWIDKNSPYRLKYHTRGVDYEVSVHQVYDAASTTELNSIYPGMVVALNENGKLKKALFPDDLENVVGIVSQKNTAENKISISKVDKLILSATEVNNVFVDIADATLSELKGAPIYWFIGRQKKSGTSFTYTDSSKHKGKLTFCTPSGYQWKKTKIEDDCFNVGYDNLPIVGTVGDISYSGSDITSLTINTNFNGFDKSISWSYPYTDDTNLSRGVLTPTNNIANVDICHGLFPNSKTIKARCFCDVIAMPNGASDDTEFQVSAIVDNFYSTKEQEAASEVRHTHIEVHTPDTYRYNIHGTVVYKFQKGAK